MKTDFKTFAIISIDDLPKVNFNEVAQTNEKSVRRSIDLTKFILSWNNTPSFIENESIIPIGVYNYTEILKIVKGDDWSDNNKENEL